MMKINSQIFFCKIIKNCMNINRCICKPGNFLQPISIIIHLASLIKENNNACHFFESGALFGHCKRHIISDCMQSRSNDRNLILYMSRNGHYQYVWYDWFFPAISDDKEHT